jgi:hypothetical protein
MKRIIFVPQYPTPLRYQEWFYTEFPKQFKKAGYEVHILGDEALKHIQGAHQSADMFSPIDAAIEFEAEQIKEYMSMVIRVDDILFVADISFPGFFTNVLYHKRPNKTYAYCHATSANILDYFENMRHSKFLVETAHSRLFDEVFVGSYYHQRKLKWTNTNVVRLPFPPFKKYANLIQSKSVEIVSASRPTKQKVDLEVEKHFKVIRRDQIKGLKDTWQDYYTFLSMSKILLITAHEDTFGYQIVDAVLNDCVPLAPNRCAYPEILPEQYIYHNLEDLKEKIDMVKAGKLKTPSLICEGEMKMFYENLIHRME